VVLSDVPPNSIAVGVPARIIARAPAADHAPVPERAGQAADHYASETYPDGKH
jgi:serine acetyltransferase